MFSLFGRFRKREVRGPEEGKQLVLPVTIHLADRYRGALVGLAGGDAVGTTLEFETPGNFRPITDMVGGGPFRLNPGEWTDDASTALCLTESLLECNGFDARDQMERYLRWFETGYLSSTGTCFDIGATMRGALLRYKQTGDSMSGSTDPHRAGNGSLMRLVPVVLFFYPNKDWILRYAAESSRTTHGAQECVDACVLYAEMLFKALGGASKEEILNCTNTCHLKSPSIREVAEGSYRRPGRKIAGTGYVVKSLEAALWSFWSTDSFESAILAAANLGDDADTTAAICGQLAGAYYGMTGIPEKWVEKLAMKEKIVEFADRLYEHSMTS